MVDYFTYSSDLNPFKNKINNKKNLHDIAAADTELLNTNINIFPKTEKYKHKFKKKHAEQKMQEMLRSCMRYYYYQFLERQINSVNL